MNLTTEHATGFAVGVGVAALGFYLYKKNQGRIDGFLRQQGINIPTAGAKEPANMTLEELVATKERLEDLIAEREMSVQDADAEAEPRQPEIAPAG